MQFLMLVCQDAQPVESPCAPRMDVDTWVTTMDSSGKRIVGDRIAADKNAVAVRLRNDEVIVTDGPYIETKEIVAGFDVLECRDLAEAVEVAAAHPMATVGVLELRPVWTD